jgi:PST family polysaccharide transporter
MLSVAREEPERYRRIFLLAYQSSLLLTVPGVVLLVAAAREVVSLVMGQQWVGGAPIFALLAVGSLAQLATGPLTMLFVSQGRAREAMISSIVTSIFLSCAFVIGLPWGAAGVAAGFALGELIRTPFMLWYACRSGPVSFADTWRVIWPFVAVVALAYLLVTLMAAWIDGLANPFLFAVAAASAAYAVAVPCLLLNGTGRRYLGEMAALVLSFSRRAAPAH